MFVHTDLDKLPVFSNAIVTIGTFDGVHTGHQKIIAQLKAAAADAGGETVIITFSPHPRRIVGGQLAEIRLLNTLPERIELLRAQGVDHLVVVPFTREFSDQLPEDYIEHFLVKRFQPHTLIIGYDHRFGRNRAGDYHLLESLKERFGYRVKEIPQHILRQVTISSTKVRQDIINGQIAAANEFLGYPYFFEGMVVEGNKLGRTIGYPTANLQITDAEKLVPGNGVYAVTVAQTTGGKAVLHGMMNIGMRPTVDGSRRTIEVHIFNFNADIYGQTLRVLVHHYLRGEVKFSGLDALKAQLAADAIAASEILRK